MNRTAAILAATFATLPRLATAAPLGPDPEETAKPHAAPVKADPRTVSPEGFGPVHPGMTVAAVEKALGVKLRQAAPATAGAEPCRTADTPDIPGATFVVRGDKVERIEFYGAAYRTSAGLRVGARSAEVKAHHFGARPSPHRYDAAGQYLTVLSGDGKAALVFETDGAVVTSFRWGSLPAVAMPDSCPAPGEESRTAAR